MYSGYERLFWNPGGADAAKVDSLPRTLRRLTQ